MSRKENQKLLQTGEVEFSGATTISGALTQSGAATMSGATAVISASDIDITGADLDITSAATDLSGAVITLSGADIDITGADLDISSAATDLSGAVTTISSASTILSGGDIDITGADLDISSANCTISGAVTLISSADTQLTGADVAAPFLRDEVALTAAAGPAGVTITDKALVPRKITMTVTALVLSLTEALDYVGVKLIDLPDSNLLLLGCEVDLETTKGLTGGGIIGTTDITMGIGTAVASATPLATTMENVIELQAMTATDDTPAYQDHSESNVTPLPITLADGAANALYLNLTAAITTDDTLTCTGTVTLYYVDLGNLSS